MHFLDAKLAFAGAATGIRNGSLYFSETHAVRIADHGDDEASVGADGDAHVVVVFVDQILAVDFGIHCGHVFQGLDAGFYEEAHEAEFDAVATLEQLFVFVAHCHDGGHVDIVECREHRGCVLGVFQASGDGLAEAGHADAFFAGLVISRSWCGLGHERR